MELTKEAVKWSLVNVKELFYLSAEEYQAWLKLFEEKVSK